MPTQLAAEIATTVSMTQFLMALQVFGSSEEDDMPKELQPSRYGPPPADVADDDTSDQSAVVAAEIRTEMRSAR